MTLRRLTAMRGVIFQFCLTVYALEVEIDEHGSVFNRRPTSTTGAGGIAVALEEEAQEALRHFAANDDNERSIAGAGGIAVVLEALRTHAQDLEVQRQGLGALWNLAHDAYNRRSIAGAGGVAVVFEALRLSLIHI